MLVNGDCLEEIQKLVDNGVQVDSIVTDPPYHLTSIVERFGKEGSAPAKDKDGAFQRQSKGFMGKEWDGGDIAFRKETWELFMKVLKPGGHLLAFSGSRTYHRMAVAIEDAGFSIRDQIMWLYGSGFPKSHNIGKGVDKKLGNNREVVGTIERGSVKDAIAKGVGYTADPANKNNKAVFGYGTETVTKGNSEWEGWGTALKPAHEPIVLARKPLSENSIVANVLKHRTGGLHIDECRIEYADENDRSGWHKTGGGGKGYMDTDTFKIREISPEEIQERTSKGRFPANVMHDGSEEVLKVFPSTSKSAGGGGVKTTGKNVYGKYNGREYDKTIGYGDEGSVARYFYCPKTSKSERDRGLDSFETKKEGMSNGAQSHGEGYGKKEDIGLNKIIAKKNNHPTVKPIKLMKYLCKLVTPKGGTVLDPFMGSGSTGIAAKDEGFEFIGIEKEKEYFEIAEQRISVASPLEEFMK